jgi:hypothetical protein
MVSITMLWCADGASVFKEKRSGVITELQQKHAPFVEGVHYMVKSSHQCRLCFHHSFRFYFFKFCIFQLHLMVWF